MTQKQFNGTEELERIVRAKEQGSGHVTLRDQPSPVKYVPPPLRRDIRRNIYDVVFAANGAIGRGEIAKLLQLKKTPWLTAAIEGLVTDGYLVKSQDAWRNGCLMYRYEVAR